MTTINPTINGIPAYALSVTRTINAPEDITYKIYGPDGAGMQAGALPPNGGILPVSFGAGTYATMLSTGAQLVWDQPGYVSETGKSIGTALQDSAYIHRFTAQQISVQDAFNGGLNGISTSAPNTITNLLPDQQGIAKTNMGVLGQGNSTLQFTFNLDGSVQNQTIDIDINEDNLLHATELICQRMGAFVDPQRTNFVIDSGAKTVTIGQVGAGSIAFGDSGDAPVLRMSTAQAQSTDMCTSCSFTGGDTSHGLPPGSTITDLVTIGENYAVIGVYTQIDIGGVYFWRGDNAFYPMSQAMGVRGLWYDWTTDTLYAATDAGVYVKAHPDVFSRTPFTRLGTMSLACRKVQVEAGTIYTLAAFKTGSSHILKYNSTSASHLGYDGWDTMVSQPDLIDFAAMGFWVYGVRANNGGVIDANATDGSTGQYVIPDGSSVIGLDASSQNGNASANVFVRTDQGSSSLYRIDTGGNLTHVGLDSSLVDDYGAPVMINSVRANPANQLLCSIGQRAAPILAGTSIGVFGCGDPTGAGGWYRTDGQSAIGTFVCTVAAATQSSFHQGRLTQGVYATSSSGFYVSNNGSMQWVDGLSLPLDAGPYFFNFFWANGTAPGDAASIPVQYGGTSYTLYRFLNGINQFVYALVNPASAAPAFAHRSSEFSELSAPALMSPITASRVIVEGMARFLAYTAEPQVLLEVESFTDDASSTLMQVQPGWTATVDEVPTDYIVMPAGAPFSLGTLSGTYTVLAHAVTYDRDADPGAITTKTTLGKLYLDSRTDATKILSDQMYSHSRSVLYRGKR